MHGTTTTSRRGVRRGCIVALLATTTVAAPACTTNAPRDPLDALDVPQWEVAAEPSLTIADDGSEATLFSTVAARRLPGGDVVVADQGSATIHVFARDGTLRRTLARRGQGPGELQGAFTLLASADTLFAFGRAPMSPPDMHVFLAGTGFLSRSRPETDSLRVLTVNDRLATGELVVTRGSAFRVINDLPEPGTVLPDTMVHGLWSAAPGESRGRVTWLPPIVSHHLHTFPWKGGPVPTSIGASALAPRTIAAASGDRLWFVDGGSGVLWAVDGAGREVARGRLGVASQPFDAAALDARRARELVAARRALDSARIVAMYDPAIRPAAMPLASAAHAGVDGELWVRLYDVDETAPQRYLVVNRAGAVVARATVPAGVEVQQVGRDFVLGVRTDGLGVPTVVEHALERR